MAAHKTNRQQMQRKKSCDLVDVITKERFEWENRCLGKYAFPSKLACRESDGTDPNSKPSGAIPDLRNPFAHDTDRIIHSHSYARYMDKTQVFFQIKNDHITRRALHVQMVSRIARTIGRCLELNEDLIEAIAIGHDIGHTPFGHAGESVLGDILQERNAGTFVHNAQSVRVLRVLEHRGKGCILTLQVLDGILGHNGELETQRLDYDHSKLTWKNLDENLLKCFSEKGYDKKVFPSTMEGCVVRVADLISYLGRDFDDAVTLKIIDHESLPIEIRRVLGSENRDIVNRLTSDIIETSHGKNYISFSDEVFEAFKAMKKFNYKHIYGCPLITEQKRRFSKMVRDLFNVYMEDIVKADAKQSIFKDFINCFPDSYLCEPYERIVVDFIAGMTDQYFLKQYQLRFMPQRIDYDELGLLAKII